jgi:DNA helicase-2/ATP-dependent DNA helicase PcrA
VINSVFGKDSTSKHHAVTHCTQFFNRLSEECIEPETLIPKIKDPALVQVVRMYALYRSSLRPDDAPARTDFSLLQQDALRVLEAFPGSGQVFQHVVVDEYQDTNSVQERIFFRLASGNKNICVVGDDDQALYRFRGARVENFVEFPERCATNLGSEPNPIPLVTNYRSRRRIVDFYTRFIDCCDWKKPRGGFFRVAEKVIKAHSCDRGPAVVATTPAKPDVACAEMADLICEIIESGKVEDPSQIAVLFPSLKAKPVQRLKEALEERGQRVYAPRAGRFLQVEEAVDLFGLFLHVFGRPVRGDFAGEDYRDFHDWVDTAYARGQELRSGDRALDRFVKDRQKEIETAVADYQLLAAVVERKKWNPKEPYDLKTMKRPLYEASGLSPAIQRHLGSTSFEKIIKRRQDEGRPFALSYILNSVTALDWSVLDLFYRLCGFDHFRQMFDLAESGEDEGPICNLGLISQYLARFQDEYLSLITARTLKDDGFVRVFFSLYLFALFRRGESEYEDSAPWGRRGTTPTPLRKTSGAEAWCAPSAGRWGLQGGHRGSAWGSLLWIGHPV